MPPHPLTNFEIQKYYENEPKFNGVYSRNNLPKIKDGAYVISWGVWINRKSFDSFVWMVITEEYLMMQLCTFSNVWILFIGFIDLIFKRKSLLDYTNLFFHNNYEKNDKIILKYFQ